MIEEIEVICDGSSIKYEIIVAERAASVYKKMRGLAKVLSECEDYDDFHEFIKKLKPSGDYTVISILVDNDGFYCELNSGDFCDDDAENNEDIDIETEID